MLPRKSPGTPAPLYRHIAALLTDAIHSGAFPVGTLLPTEQELCAQYRVSRFTVREALRILESLGLVSRRQGQGTMVRGTQDRPTYRLSLQNFSDIEQHGYYTRLTDIEAKDIVADAALAAELPCAPGDRFVRVSCYREPADDTVSVPTAWNQTFIVAAYGAVATRVGKHAGPIYGLIERHFGETIREIEQEVCAVLLEAAVARKLAVRARSAGLRVKRTYFGRDRQPVMFAWNTYSADHFNLTMRFRHE